MTSMPPQPPYAIPLGGGASSKTGGWGLLTPRWCGVVPCIKNDIRVEFNDHDNMDSAVAALIARSSVQFFSVVSNFLSSISR